MSTETVIRGFFAGVYALILVWGVSEREDRDWSGAEGKGQRYQPYIPNIILPWILVALAVLGPLLYGWEVSVEMLLDICFQVFLQICLYYLLLLPALPLLRRRVNARACAALWMIPNYLYVVAQTNIMKWRRPLWVLRIPGRLIWILLALWLLGFLGVLGGKTLSHLRFRRRVLREAEPVTDPDILEVWQAELDRARFTGKLRGLARSPAVRTPLTVGLFRRFAWVLLPREASYAREDLELVLRHEIVHICRDDAWSKFFLVFCTAMCWFNPLMWTAMDRCAEDLELSCDETVLLHGTAPSGGATRSSCSARRGTSGASPPASPPRPPPCGTA